ncbi:unnamed protein product [Camellia sinensis]
MSLAWQIGKTKVFLRAGQMAEVDATAEVLGNAANKIQRQIHTYIARKEFISIRKAAIQLQSCWRGFGLGDWEFCAESSSGGKAFEEEGRYEKAMEEFNSKLVLLCE